MLMFSALLVSSSNNNGHAKVDVSLLPNVYTTEWVVWNMTTNKMKKKNTVEDVSVGKCRSSWALNHFPALFSLLCLQNIARLRNADI
jgi:hypothetical protein